MTKYCPIDFEYNQSSEPQLNLVCCALEYGQGTKSIWLHNNQENKERLKKKLLQLNDEGYIFLAYSVVAEGRSFMALGINPAKIKWIDLYLEYRCLTNHNHELQYGKQLIDGRKLITKPPKSKWQQTEEEKKKANSSKPQHNLSACVYKLLGKVIDTGHKKDMRDLIISNPAEFTEREKKDILKYCESDIKYLRPLLDKVNQNYVKLIDRCDDKEENAQFKKALGSEMLNRADYAARTAIMEEKGYPINVEWTKNFSNSVYYIIKECQEDINSQFPDNPPFKWNRREFRYSWNQTLTKEWVKNSGLAEEWVLTDKGAFSLSLEAFTKHFQYRHDYPRGNFGAQIVRYLKLKQSLNGFLPKGPNSKTKSFWDAVGSDGRVRSFMGIYGAQSSRSQPSATSFLFLKSAWMRSLCEPPKGKYLGAYDYGSEEFLLSGLWAPDLKMIEAYESGDVYLFFAKLAGAVPTDGMRKDYEEVRDRFKSTTLGISYLMSKYGLAKKLTADTGVETSTEEAQTLINDFDAAFTEFSFAREDEYERYLVEKRTKLPCGWYMWGDNDNFRSVSNCPIQGLGASLMRRAVQLAQDRGLTVIFTLHDALYIEGDIGNEKEDMDTLAECMDEAFKYYFRNDEEVKDRANVRLDGYVWSREFEVGEIITNNGNKLDVYDIYIDPRAKSEYKKFSKYFLTDVLEDIEML